MVKTTGAGYGTPAAGSIAYVASGDAGYISSVASNTNKANLAIGRFLSTADEDGYYKVEVNLPGTQG